MRTTEDIQVPVFGVERVSRNVSVKVDPIDFLNALKRKECKVPIEAKICQYGENKGKVITREDVSHHGSPIYEDTVYDVSEEDIELIKKIEDLINTLKKRYKG